MQTTAVPRNKKLQGLHWDKVWSTIEGERSGNGVTNSDTGDQVRPGLWCGGVIARKFGGFLGGNSLGGCRRFLMNRRQFCGTH